MKPRFQTDADFNEKILHGLRRREPSIDFRDAHQGGVIGEPDEELLRIAADAGRILVSHDRNTMISHFARFTSLRSSPGLLIISQDLEIGAAIEDLLLVWAASELEEWENSIGFVPI